MSTWNTCQVINFTRIDISERQVLQFNCMQTGRFYFLRVLSRIFARQRQQSTNALIGVSIFALLAAV
jgi:hypothetical protein